MAAGLALCGAAAGCSQAEHDNSRREAHKLYIKQVKLIGSYIDSLRHAPDSATVYRLDSRFQEQLTRLNMNAEAELDTKLTEGENDTLFLLTERYIKLRNRKVGKMKDIPVVTDTLATDSAKSEE